MKRDSKRDAELEKARQQLHQLNLDLKVQETEEGLRVVAFERVEGKERALRGVPPLPYPSRELAQWVGDVSARMTRS